jgi:hypothetical protein
MSFAIQCFKSCVMQKTAVYAGVSRCNSSPIALLNILCTIEYVRAS